MINASASERLSQRSSSASQRDEGGEGGEGGTASLRMSGAEARARLASGASALRLPASAAGSSPRASAAGGGGEAPVGREAGIDEVWAGFEAAVRRLHVHALRMRTARARHTRRIRTPCAPGLSPPASPDPDPDPDPAPEAEQVRQSFEAYDTSGAGRLSPADAEAALGAVGLQLAPGRAA